MCNAVIEPFNIPTVEEEEFLKFNDEEQDMEM